jgi:aspartate/methionine/tyrosine aminotransferase
MRFPSYALTEYQAQNNSKASARLGAASLELMSLSQVLALATPAQLSEWQNLTLNYVPDRGGIELRAAIAANYSGLSADNVVVFSSATEALFCCIHAAVKQSDRCTVITPCYEPLVKIPESIGAAVNRIPLRREGEEAAEARWVLDGDEIREAIAKSNQLFINFPHNPTGALIDHAELAELVAHCETHGTRLIADEVFRGLEHAEGATLEPVATLTAHGVSIGSLAKPHGAGGVRIGWMVSQDSELLTRAVTIRRSLSVCSGTTDEWLARLILAHSQTLRTASLHTLRRHVEQIEESLPMLDGRLTWTKPAAGCVAFPLITLGDGFDQRCIEEIGIMLVPQRCFVGSAEAGDREGAKTLTGGIRLGYGLADFPEVWARFVEFLVRH